MQIGGPITLIVESVNERPNRTGFLECKFPYEVAVTMRDVLNYIITADPAPSSQGIEARRRAAAGIRRR